MNQVSTYELYASKAIPWMHHLTAADTQNTKGSYKQPEPPLLWMREVAGGHCSLKTVLISPVITKGQNS